MGRGRESWTRGSPRRQPLPAPRHTQLPQVLAPAQIVAPADRLARPRPRQQLEPLAPNPGPRGQVGEARVGAAALALGDQGAGIFGAQAGYVAQADADRQLAARRGVDRAISDERLDRALHGAPIDVRRQHLDPTTLRFMHQRVGRVEAHRLLVQKRAEELGGVVDPQPGRLVGEQAEGDRVGLRKPEPGEAANLLEDALRHLRRRPAPPRPGDELIAIGEDRLLGALAAHRPAQPLRLAGAEPGKRHRHLDHLLLKDDRPQRVAKDRLQRGVVVGHPERGIPPQPLAALQVGMHGAPLNRPRAHQRHLDREVVEALRLRPRQHLHLRPALDLKDAGGVRRPDHPVGLRVVHGDPGEVDPLATHASDLVDRALHRRQHPQAQQIDLQEAGVRARVLVPLNELAPLHRRRLDGTDVDQRPGGDHHPAGVLRGMAWEPPRVASQAGEGAPAHRRGSLGADRHTHVRLHGIGAVEQIDRPSHSLDLSGRQAERLAEVAGGAARSIAGKCRDQRRALLAVALDGRGGSASRECRAGSPGRCRAHR